MHASFKKKKSSLRLYNYSMFVHLKYFKNDPTLQVLKSEIKKIKIKNVTKRA